MHLKELKEKGGFVSSGLATKKLSWEHKDENGKDVTDEFEVFVKKLSFGLVSEIYDTNEKRQRVVLFVHHGIRLGDKGQEQMSYDDAYNLKMELATLLSNAVVEVNGLNQKEEEAKN